VPPTLGPSSYRANEGTSIAFKYGPSDPTGLNAGMLPPNGPFFTDSACRITDITDGTSNTAAFSEIIIGDFSNAVASEIPDLFTATTTPPDADQAVSDCAAVNVNDLSTQGLSNIGGPWLLGGHASTCYQHAPPPGTRGCLFPLKARQLTAASSYHNRGVNLLLCDGSVRFVSYGIDLATWRAIGSRNGGETPGDY
jgi:prepilin-type processing-associated H-X9-DG protein